MGCSSKFCDSSFCFYSGAYLLVSPCCSSGCLQTPLSGSLSLNRSKAAYLQNQQIESMANILCRPAKQGQWSKRVTCWPVGGCVYSAGMFRLIIAHPLWTVPYGRHKASAFHASRGGKSSRFHRFPASVLPFPRISHSPD